MAMSRTQRLVSRLLPASWAAAMEEASKSWMVRCPSCGFERSVWEWGGILWKFAGKKFIWQRCPSCGQRGWHTLHRRQAGGDSPES